MSRKHRRRVARKLLKSTRGLADRVSHTGCDRRGLTATIERVLLQKAFRITLAQFRRDVFASAIDQATVRSLESESVEALTRFSDGHFDWIYSDADHSYTGAKRDIDAVRIAVVSAPGRVARTPAEPIGKGLLMHDE